MRQATVARAAQAALVCAAVTGALALASAPAGRPAAASGCGAPPAQPELRPAEGTPQLVHLTLSSPDTAPVRFDFDNHRGTSDHTISLRASPALERGAEIAAEVEGDLYRADGGDTFPAEAVVVSPPRVAQSGGFVRVPICLDSTVENVDEGRYIGTVQLTGALIEPTAIPLEATLRAPRRSAIAAIVFGLALGLLLKVGGDLKREGDDGPSLRTSVARYVKRVEFVYAFLVGVLVGVISYVQLYEASDVWGTGPDWLKLTMVGVAAQVTGMTALDIVKPFKA